MLKVNKNMTNVTLKKGNSHERKITSSSCVGFFLTVFYAYA